ncbi:MAG: hypothetical protein R3F35_15910 [Myxococcota bacterium]
MDSSGRSPLNMSNPLEHFGLDRSPFADESPAVGVIGTRALRKVVARVQAALRDGRARIGVHGPAGIGKTCLAAALPKLFAGHARVATISDPSLEWPTIRAALARSWQLDRDRLSRATLVAAAAQSRLVLVVDRAEDAPESLLGHLDVLQDIADERGEPIVAAILFVQSPAESDPTPSCAALAWLERHQAARLPFEPLTPDGVADYIQRKLRRAGHADPPIFTPRAALVIHAETGGVPGAVSRLCDALLHAAAARRLRSVDEPFARTRGESTALHSTLADETGIAWDDADHHPRETSGEALAIPAMRLDAGRSPRTTRATGSAGARAPAHSAGATPFEGAEGPTAAGARIDPELEAYLSAPPSADELRAIRGGFVRRVARPFLLASLAVAVGGLLLALWMRHDGSTAEAPADDSSRLPALDRGAVDHAGAIRDVRVAEIDGVVLGRLRGPVTAPARAGPLAPGGAPPREVREVARVPIAARAESNTRAGRDGRSGFEALVGTGSPLGRARDFAEDGQRSSASDVDARHEGGQDAKLSESPDLRPAGFVRAADPASPDL